MSLSKFTGGQQRIGCLTEPDGETENKRQLAQFKLRQTPCSKRPIAGRAKGRSDGDDSHCLGDGKRANSKSSKKRNKGKTTDDFEEDNPSENRKLQENVPTKGLCWAQI